MRYPLFSWPINKKQIIIGLVALFIGSVIYLIDRPPEHTYFVYNSPINISLSNTIPNLFGSIGNSLPAFLHVFSFILITAGLIFCNKRGYLIICLSWFLIDCVFEVGQKFTTWSSRIIPDWFAGIPFLENTENYFLKGTFDFLDLAAIAFGTVIAYFVLLTTNKRKRRVMS
jgi:ABC-type xylose transport system permease subunit